MTAQQLEVLAVLEVVGLIMIFRLWRRNVRRGKAFKIFWTLTLLIPLFGPLMYGFFAIDASSHNDDLSDATGGIDPDEGP